MLEKEGEEYSKKINRKNFKTRWFELMIYCLTDPKDWKNFKKFKKATCLNFMKIYFNT